MDIRAINRDLAAKRAGVVASSEPPEIRATADGRVVFAGGGVVKEPACAEMSEAAILGGVVSLRADRRETRSHA